jgi:hypothetical protein
VKAAAAVTMLPLLALLLGGAPAAYAVPVVTEPDLPVPPIPPEFPPGDTAAPVPDIDVSPPAPLTENGLSVHPTLNQGMREYPGGDPVPGTLYRSDQVQRRQFIPNPGIKLVVPLEK